MVTSKLASRRRTTVPRQVRAALRLEPGDSIEYVIERDRIVAQRAPAVLWARFATFSEWNSEADRRAYRKL
jgi:antitoxin PrlF